MSEDEKPDGKIAKLKDWGEQPVADRAEVVTIVAIVALAFFLISGMATCGEIENRIERHERWHH